MTCHSLTNSCPDAERRRAGVTEALQGLSRKGLMSAKRGRVMVKIAPDWWHVRMDYMESRIRIPAPDWLEDETLGRIQRIEMH